MSRKTYTKEFKEEVVAYWDHIGATAKEVGAHFGISHTNLGKRKKTYGVPSRGLHRSSREEADIFAENLRLKKENQELLMRCEILKKTVGIVSEPIKRNLKW